MKRQPYRKEPTRAFFQDYDVMSVIDKEVMDIYSKHFLKVSQSFPLNGSCRKNLPDTLRPCFKEAVLEKMQDKTGMGEDTVPRPFHSGSP